MANARKPAAKMRPSSKLTPARLNEMIKEATVDAYDEWEQLTGFSTMIEDNLETPFQTEILDVEVTVEAVEMTEENRIVALCRRGNSCQKINIVDLPLPSPPPKGWEWIEAYRQWSRLV